MLQTSEWVSHAHPDKIADGITSYILDRHLEQDPEARYAVEVMIKDDHVILAGEVTSRADFTNDDYAEFVRDAVNAIGYDSGYLDKWGEQNTICGDRLDVQVMIGKQSPDIACGISRGWGDQGIFWGMATGDASTAFLPKDYWLAKTLGEEITESGIGGIDVKTQITLSSGSPSRAIVAVPLLNVADAQAIKHMVHDIIGRNTAVIVNGTGRYVVHGPVGDSGVTGRKLCVDFYGGNCRVGGGSPWGKDASKADVTLNLYARKLALDYLIDHGLGTVYCSICCAIGRPEIEIAFYNAKNKQVECRVESRPPLEIIDELGLREPNYSTMCRKGLFTWN